MRPKADGIASLMCRTVRTEPKNKKRNEENWKQKKRDAQKKRSSHKIRGVIPEAERESMVWKICESGRF